MSKHTPGKLEAVHHQERRCEMQPEYWTIEGTIVGRSGVIADTLNRDHCIDPEEDRANVARIVRAANCHDLMLAALKAAFDDLRDVPGRKAPPSMAIVEAAIAKAESE